MVEILDAHRGVLVGGLGSRRSTALSRAVSTRGLNGLVT